MIDSMRLMSERLQFSSGHEMKNRFMLAPMTNCQSNPDGTLSDDELNWLVMRARGGFSLTMTCAAHVQRIGKGFPGQLGIFSDDQCEGHRALSTAIKSYDSLAVVQLHHAGMRTPRSLINGHPVSPSAQSEQSARALLTREVEVLRDDFIAAAVRAKQCGYDGVEVHGAHGYILAQFLSAEYNRRQDHYGGVPENRIRLILEILDGIRARCGPQFLLGLRLSPERFGMKLKECVWFARRVIEQGYVHFIDISLWDAFKYPEEAEFAQQPLLEYFTQIPRGEIKLTVAGKIKRSVDAAKLLEAGVDFVGIGRGAIVHHDFARRALADARFETTNLPVSRDYLRNEGLSDVFVEYMRKWPCFVEDV